MDKVLDTQLLFVIINMQVACRYVNIFISHETGELGTGLTLVHLIMMLGYAVSCSSRCVTVPLTVWLKFTDMLVRK